MTINSAHILFREKAVCPSHSCYHSFHGKNNLVSYDRNEILTTHAACGVVFQAFGAEMEMAMYLGEDEGDIEDIDENSSGGIVIETLSNIRTVASLTLEEKRAADYIRALEREDPHPIKTNMIKGEYIHHLLI